MLRAYKNDFLLL